MVFSISYDFHKPAKESDRPKMYDYINHLLVSANCRSITKFTDSNIFVTSGMSLDSFESLLNEHFQKNKKLTEILTITIAEVARGEDKKLRLKIINSNKGLTTKFNDKIAAIQKLSKEKLDAELAGFITYFA